MVLEGAGGHRMGDLGLIIFLIMTIIAGVVLMTVAMNNRRAVREMEHRERLAMIERGVVPSPEANPAAFEAAVGFTEPSKDEDDRTRRYRTAGVLLIGFGLGLIFVIGVAAGSPEVGWGIGGAWISLGGASLLNYWLMSRRTEDKRARWTPPARRPDPPPNVVP
jgi:Domain of unknown function (DUF6249)